MTHFLPPNRAPLTRTTLVFATLATLAACSGGGDDDKGGDSDDTGGSGGASFEDYIYVTQEASGDFGDFDGFEAMGGWSAQEVDATAQVEVPLIATIEDFQDGYEVPEATLELWYGDAIDGLPNQTMYSDSDGIVFGNGMVCTPMASRLWTDPALDETKDTYEFHRVSHNSGGIDDTWSSVSVVTYQLIPSLLGVSPDPDKGVVAGRAYDVMENPVEGAQVVVRDLATGEIPEGTVIKYFVDDFPNRNQEWTSADGLWVAINLPVGSWSVEMYIADGEGGHKLMGATTLPVFADTINISSIHTSYGDGVKYPANCTVGFGE